MIKNNLKDEGTITKLLYNQVALVLAILGVAFGVYFTLSNPTRSLENRINNLENNIISNKELQNQLTTIQENDLHTIQVKLEETIVTINDLSKEVVKLQTILEERLPQKK